MLHSDLQYYIFTQKHKSGSIKNQSITLGRAVNLTEDNPARALAEMSTPEGSGGVRIAELSADDHRIFQVPALVAYCPPGIAKLDLHPSFVGLVSPGQANFIW